MEVKLKYLVFVVPKFWLICWKNGGVPHSLKMAMHSDANWDKMTIVFNILIIIIIALVLFVRLHFKNP